MQQSTGVLPTQRQAGGDTRGPGATENDGSQVKTRWQLDVVGEHATVANTPGGGRPAITTGSYTHMH